MIMKMVDGLSIFRHTIDLTIKLTDILENFPKKYKFTLGDRLMDFALDLEADAALMKKLDYDRELHEKMINKFTYDYYLFKSVFRIVIEKKLIEIKRMTEIVVLLEKIEKLSGIKYDFLELDLIL